MEVGVSGGFEATESLLRSAGTVEESSCPVSSCRAGTEVGLLSDTDVSGTWEGIAAGSGRVVSEATEF